MKTIRTVFLAAAALVLALAAVPTHAHAQALPIPPGAPGPTMGIIFLTMVGGSVAYYELSGRTKTLSDALCAPSSINRGCVNGKAIPGESTKSPYNPANQPVQTWRMGAPVYN